MKKVTARGNHAAAGRMESSDAKRNQTETQQKAAKRANANPEDVARRAEMRQIRQDVNKQLIALGKAATEGNREAASAARKAIDQGRARYADLEEQGARAKINAAQQKEAQQIDRANFQFRRADARWQDAVRQQGALDHAVVEAHNTHNGPIYDLHQQIQRISASGGRRSGLSALRSQMASHQRAVATAEKTANRHLATVQTLKAKADAAQQALDAIFAKTGASIDARIAAARAARRA